MTEAGTRLVTDKITASVEEQMSVLMRGVEYGDANIQRTMEEDLRELLSTGRPLRVYAGFDPTFTGIERMIWNEVHDEAS